MYVIAEMRDVVHIKPWKFDQDLRALIEDELNKKFSNKVVYELGLCIALYDILKIEDSYVFPGDGSSHTKVTFRFVVFRPFIDEVLMGEVKSSSKEGIHVSMTFFDDIFIPANNIPEPSRFDEKEQVFVWQFDPSHEFFIDVGEQIRFRVVEEQFVDTSPSGPVKKNELGTVSISQNKDESKCPYTIIGSINESGLGLVSWWK